MPYECSYPNCQVLVQVAGEMCRKHKMQKEHEEGPRWDVSAKQNCPLVELVELVEVVTEGKGEVPVTGVADTPKDGIPIPWKSELAGLKRPTNPERQYINLPRKFRGFGHGGAPHHGRYIEFRARVNPKGDASGSLAGKMVHFSYTPTYGAGRPAPIYEGGKEGFGHQKLATLRTYTNKDGWTGVVRFNMSMYGGDKFKIAAQADENNDGQPEGTKLETGDYEVWKEIRYTLACMKRPDGSDYSDRVREAEFKSEFEKSFIKMTRTGGLSKPAHQRWIEKDDAKSWATSKLPAQADRTLNFALIDTLIDGQKTRPFNYEFDPPRYEWFIRRLGGANYTFDLSAKNKWLISAKYYDKNQPSVSHALPNDKVNLTLTQSGLYYELSVDLRGVVTGGLALNRIKVVLALQERGIGSGLAEGPNIFVAMRCREGKYSGNPEDSTLHTMFHESGHFLGLAPKKLPNKSQSTNPYYYDEDSLRVGRGPHCSYDKENPATKADLPATPDCIMFHDFTFTLNFCTNCSNSLRGRDLSSPSVNGKTAGY
ncbi:MAG: hypothetical protein ACETWQ_06910 [Phycisphaerae bacterium]